MPNKKVSSLSELTTPATGDYLLIVDVSDTTDGAAGTSKKVQIANLPSSGGEDKWRIFGSSNVSGTGERYVGIRGNYVDTSAPNLYTQAMLPENCELVSISCRIGATANATWRAYASGTKIYDSGLQAFTANVAQTFTPSGATASQGQMIAVSVEASATPADVYCVLTLQAT